MILSVFTQTKQKTKIEKVIWKKACEFPHLCLGFMLKFGQEEVRGS